MKIPNEGCRERPAADVNEPPPFLRTWNRLYAAIILYTIALVLALYVMTIALNR